MKTRLPHQLRTHLAWLVALSFSLPTPLHAVVDVIIDPGHGGHDIGAPGFNGDPVPNEEQLALAVSQALELRLLILGFTSRLTRTTDFFFELNQRAEIASGQRANENGFVDTCDLFISIHLDGNDNNAIFGSQVFYSPTKYFSKKKDAFQSSKDAAEAINPDFMANAAVVFVEGFCHHAREITAKGYRVLRKSTPPAVLIEVCFLSNFCQFTEIQKAGDQNQIAAGIAAGVSGYLNAPKRTNSGAIASDRVVPAPRSRGLTLQEGFEGVTFPPTGWTVETSGAPAPHV